MDARIEQKEPGIYAHHSRACSGSTGNGSCTCKPTYQATFWNQRDRRRIKKHFTRLKEARVWRADLIAAAAAGRTVAAPSRVTVAEALDTYVEGMTDGSILNKSNRQYKPSVCRSYKRSATRLKDGVGQFKLTELCRRNINTMVGQLRQEGLSASTIRNTIDPLRAVYRKAIDDEVVTTDPTYRLRLPASTGRRNRTASPVEAERLIDVLPESDQALWAMALYIGLRRGELQALCWSDLNLKEGIGKVERAWDDEGRCIVDTKSEAGARMFPIVAPVRRRLLAHKLRTGRGEAGLVFGRTARDPFVPTTVRRRALAAWEDAGLQPITLHEGRHSAATAGSAAGLDDLALAHIMGHSSVVITRDLYGHVRPDRIAEVTKTLDAYYERSS